MADRGPIHPLSVMTIPPVHAFHIFIGGDPEPAGSPKIIRMGGRPAIRWQKGPKWTATIRRVLSEEIPEEKRPLLKGPMRAWITYRLPRPKKPMFSVPATPPDIDKLERAVLDGLTLWGDGRRSPLLVEDDARFISVVHHKEYGVATGVELWVWPVLLL